MSLLRAFANLFKTLLRFVFLAAFFQRAHQHLPDKVKLASPTFWTLVAMYLLAGFIRHSLVGTEPATHVFVVLGILLALLISPFAVYYSTEVALYMAVSVGLDLAVAAVGAVTGLEMHLGNWGLAWEVLATVVAIKRRHSDGRFAATPR